MKHHKIYHILFVAALPWEMKILKMLYKDQSSQKMKADFLVSWVGSQKTSIALTEALTHKKYDFVINIWVCGYRENSRSCIQILRSVKKETSKEILTPLFFEYAPLRSILTSDLPHYDLPVEFEYGDMESYSIEHVCEYFRIPRMILKVPVDKVGEETEHFDIVRAQKMLEKNIDMKKLLEELEKYLNSLPEKTDISRYCEHYHFTASEKIIFEKYYLTFTSLSPESFKDFFQKYQHLWKKDFFKKCEEVSLKLSCL